MLFNFLDPKSLNLLLVFMLYFEMYCMLTV